MVLFPGGGSDFPLYLKAGATGSHLYLNISDLGKGPGMRNSFILQQEKKKRGAEHSSSPAPIPTIQYLFAKVATEIGELRRKLAISSHNTIGQSQAPCALFVLRREASSVRFGHGIRCSVKKISNRCFCTKLQAVGRASMHLQARRKQN